MEERKRIDIQAVMAGNTQDISWEDVIFNGYSGLYQDKPWKPGQIKVACVGDSITYGHGIFNWPKKNYPVILGKLLGEKYHVRNFGVCGCAVQDFSDQPYREQQRYRESICYEPDILVLMMGTNDSKPENWHGKEAFRTSLCSLLSDYGQPPRSPWVYLCTPAAAFYGDDRKTGVTNFDVQPDVVKSIAQIVREVAYEKGFGLIDIYTLTENREEWFSVDHVHPDNHGALAIANKIAKRILADEVEK